MAEWRNWQTHQTQNLAKFTLRVGSTPTSATTSSRAMRTVASSCVALLFALQLAPGPARGQNPPPDPAYFYGLLVSRGADSVVISTAQGKKTFRVGKQTSFCCGKILNLGALKAGDSLDIQWHRNEQGGLVADRIEANIDRWEGVITRVIKDKDNAYTVYIRFDPPVNDIDKIVFDKNAQFKDCVLDNDLKRTCTPDSLRVGRHLETIGYTLSAKEMRALKVLTIY